SPGNVECRLENGDNVTGRLPGKIARFEKYISRAPGKVALMNNASISRKTFLLNSGIAAAAVFLGQRLTQAQPGVTSPAPTSPASTPDPDNVPDFPEHDPQIDRARVKRFVIAGHSNLPAVKKMLSENPNLINGAIDWGNGDFETALGGAAHMGRRDIAEYLLEHNARLDIFAATMLGKLDIVKAAVAAFPNIVNVPGPHKIPLIVHAQKGGSDAAAVLEFLRPLVAK
ncbi:MAG TPA: hypothetical protein VJ719_12610, partial [Chthoniobacterales bacterium]|nr:hypothetical protein [Chthoniobacterales bacterium]